MSSNRDWLSAREAVQRLDIKLPTLYSYASRGLVQSVPASAGRARLYATSDVERLKARHDARAGHSAVAASALRWGEPTLETCISDICAEGPRYRGIPALELLQSADSFECVAELLWTGELATHARCGVIPSACVGRSRSARVPFTIAELAAGVAQLALIDTRRRCEASADLKRARWLTGWLAACGSSEGGVEASVAERLSISLGGRPLAETARLLDRALILCADHELNASTFAARVAASAGADLHACVAAALHVLSGSLHGGASAAVEALVDEVVRERSAKRVIRARLLRGESLPGFGHRLYPRGDPRCTALFSLAEQVQKRSRRLDALQELREAMLAAGQPAGNLDVGLVTFCCALGLPRGSSSVVFALGRSAGWIAHIFEQRAQGFLLRPRARYVGQ